jgi:hypothetical protein
VKILVAYSAHANRRSGGSISYPLCQVNGSAPIGNVDGHARAGRAAHAVSASRGLPAKGRAHCPRRYQERDLKDWDPLLVIIAGELCTGSAFYFTARESGSWRLGRLALTDIPLAHAVTASAAYRISDVLACY